MNTSSAPSIQDVWMQQGGARLYYSALYGPRQQYVGGASRIDPACSPLLPPMKAWGATEPKKRSTTRKVAKPAATPCPEVTKPEAAASTKTNATGSTTAGTAAGASAGTGGDTGAASSKGGISAVQAGADSASSAAQSRAEAIAKAKAASAAEATALTKTAKGKSNSAAKPAPVSAAKTGTPQH